MAENSKRERILVAISTRLHELQWPQAIKRSRPAFDQLKTIPNTQFPFIGLTGQLPDPSQYSKRDTRSAFAQYTKFISTLRAELVIYEMVYSNDQYDSLISNRADDVWAKIYSDPSFGSLCISCLVQPEIQVGYWDPYLAFKFSLIVTYEHGTGGI